MKGRCKSVESAECVLRLSTACWKKARRTRLLGVRVRVAACVRVRGRVRLPSYQTPW